MKMLGLGMTTLLLGSLCGCQPTAAVAVDRSASTTAATPAPVAAGSIAGHVAIASDPLPALRVCAIDTGNASRHRCVRTRTGQAEYRLDDVPPGQYAVFAWSADGTQVLRARQTIMCIRAPCPPGDPIVVDLAAGDHYDRAHLNEAAAAFPGMPAQPKTD
jgi:hypothetical protein